MAEWQLMFETTIANLPSFDAQKHKDEMFPDFISVAKIAQPAHCPSDNIIVNVSFPIANHYSLEKVWLQMIFILVHPLFLNLLLYIFWHDLALDELMCDLIDTHRLTGFLIIVCPVLKQIKKIMSLGYYNAMKTHC